MLPQKRKQLTIDQWTTETREVAAAVEARENQAAWVRRRQQEEAARLKLQWPLLPPRSAGRPSCERLYMEAVAAALRQDPESVVAVPSLKPPEWWVRGLPITMEPPQLL